MLKWKTQKEMLLKFYKIVAGSMVLYGSETWILTREDKSHIEAVKITFLRSVKDCTQLDRFHNGDMIEALNIFAAHQ